MQKYNNKIIQQPLITAIAENFERDHSDHFRHHISRLTDTLPVIHQEQSLYRESGLLANTAVCEEIPA